jgi:hypothetical protein
MDKNKLWIASFQHTSGETIRCTVTCIEAKGIREAMEIADEKINMFVRCREGVGARSFITDIGIADEISRKHLNEFYEDPINDPDPDLFN